MNKYILILVISFCCCIAIQSYGQGKVLKPLLPHFKGLTKQALQVRKENYGVVAEFAYGGKKYRAYYSSDTILQSTALRMLPAQCPAVVKDDAACSLRGFTILEWLSVTSYKTGAVSGKSFRARIDVSETRIIEVFYDLKLNRIGTDLIEKEKVSTSNSTNANYQGGGNGSSGPSRINSWYAGSSLALKDSIVSHIKLDSTTCVKRFAGPQYTYWVKVDVNGKILDFDQASINISGYAPLALTDGLHSYLSRIVFPKQPYGSVFQYEVKVVLRSNGSISVEIPDYKRNY